MQAQASLFAPFEVSKTQIHSQEYVQLYDENGLSYEYADIQDVTFKAGLQESVHNWFRLTPSYSPELVRFFMRYLDCQKEHLLLEPFTGKGTTLIECQKQGMSAVGIEINPLLHSVSDKSLSWESDTKELQNIFETIKSQFFILKEAEKDTSIEEFCTKHEMEIPSIHNVFRWWKKEVLKDLLLLKKLIFTLETPSLQPFWVALSSSCLDCANIHRNHPTISFDDTHTRTINVWNEFEGKIKRVMADLTHLDVSINKDSVKVFLGDSTKLEDNLTTEKINRVITSPPYPNRFSYIHTTRPQLFFMDIIKDAKKATDIDIDAIGGTWGRATSILEKEPLAPHQDIAHILQDFITDLQPKSLLMSNYAVKYFNMMHQHIRSLKPFVSDDFKGVYVVGNSRLMNVEIHTEVLLAKIFEVEGFKVDKIMIFRKRGGKNKLFETGVCVSI